MTRIAKIKVNGLSQNGGLKITELQIEYSQDSCILWMYSNNSCIGSKRFDSPAAIRNFGKSLIRAFPKNPIPGDSDFDGNIRDFLDTQEIMHGKVEHLTNNNNKRIDITESVKLLEKENENDRKKTILKNAPVFKVTSGKIKEKTKIPVKKNDKHSDVAIFKVKL